MQAVSKAPDGSITSDRGRRRTPSFVAAAIGLLFVSPVLYLAWQTTALGSGFWARVADSGTLGPLGRSLLIAISTAALCGLLGTSLAWLVVRTDLPAKATWRWILPLPLVIPSFVGATALLSAFGPGALISWMPRIDGFVGSLFVLTLLTYPYVYLPVVARLTTTAPRLEEASRLLGASTWRTVRSVVIPQLRHSAVGGMLLVFLYALSDFGAVSIMRYDTITRAIFSARLADRATSLTLGFVLAAVALFVAWSERSLSKRTRVVREPGAAQVGYSLGRWRSAATAATASTVVFALLAPVSVFVVWVVRGSSTIGVGYSGLGDSLAFLIRPMLNSALAGVAAAVFATALVLPVAYVAARRSGWLAGFASTAVASAFALPGLVVALAIVFWALRAPTALLVLYQSFPLLVLAYVLHFGAQSMTVTRTAIANLPVRYEEAGQMLGASRMRRFRTIELPLIMPALLAGGGLVMLSTLKELPATLLLAPIGFQTLATKIWGAAEEGFFAEVGVTSLVLIGLSGVLTWLLVFRRAAD